MPCTNDGCGCYDYDECCECDQMHDNCVCSENYRSLNVKRPLTKARHVGIEIEFLAPILIKDVAKKLDAAGLGGTCQIKGDGSVEDDNGQLAGHELNVLCRESNYRITLRKVCLFLASIGATVNRTCGLHVHIDMRRRDRDLVFHNLVQCQDLFFQMQPKSRLRNNYCRRTEVTSFMEASQTYYRTAINADAYKRHKTIEVRLHAGTTNYEKISCWVAMLLKVADKSSKVVSSVSTVDAMRDKFVLSPRLVRYVRQRVSNFNSPPLAALEVTNV
jgi:Putative amidoligase enzyme